MSLLTESDVAQVQSYAWPVAPYKALSFYTEEDAPLFAGREGDLLEFANLLGMTSTRILILQGRTGCGKSSFLRAGLIPFLEGEGSGFQFLKREKDNAIKPIFVRSTDCPLIALAEEIYKFARKDIERDTPLGPSVLKLSEVLSGYRDRNDFLEKVGKSSALMVEVLSNIAKMLPKTLILIIDQAEEVYTLKPGVGGEDERNEFFDFMARFADNQYDLKLLVALRTEYFGFFYNDIRERTMDISRVRDYVLRNFVAEQVVRAITRPTSGEVIPNYGKPIDYYKFSYAPELPEKIAADLDSLVNSGNISGGILPVMQVVCDRLYQKTKPKITNGNDPWVIKKEDYLNLGGVEEQIGEYLRVALVDRCKEKGIKESEIVNETARWRDVICELARSQADGTITTEVMKEDDLRAIAVRVKCQLDFNETMEYLADDGRRILRSVEKIDVTTNKTIECYSLAHDAIGLFLRRWKVTRQEAKAVTARGKRNSLIFATGMILIGLITMLGLLIIHVSIIWGAVLLIYGLLFLIMGLVIKTDSYPASPRWWLWFLVTISPGRLAKRQFLKDTLYRERLRQYPELSERFESLLTKAE